MTGRRRKNGGLQKAQRALDRARAQHAEQDTKRQQEQAVLIGRMERLAKDNHLAALVWEVVAGNGGNR